MAYSKFDDITLPPPPTFETGEYLTFVSEKLPPFFKAQYFALLDLITSLQSEYVVSNEQIFDLSAAKISSNTQFINNVYVGAESKIALDGPNNKLSIYDSQSTPIERVKIGKLGSSSNEYGIQVKDAGGTVRFLTGSSTYLDGGILKASTVTAAAIAAGTITATELAVDSVTADEINVSNLAAINADMGNLTAGSIDGATITGTVITGSIIRTAASGQRIQMTSVGLDAYNSAGTQTLDFGVDGTLRLGPSGGNNIYWNNSTLVITGQLITTGNIVEGSVAAHAKATWSSAGMTLSSTDRADSGSSEIAVASITLETVGRDVLIFFAPTFIATDTSGVAMVRFDVVLKVRQTSITGTVIATSYIRSGAISDGSETTYVPYNSGGNVSAIDASSNGSLSTPADTVYVCTAEIENFLTGGPGLGTHAKSVTTTGTATAVELRA